MLDNLQSELNKFAKAVVKQSRTRLTKSQKSVSKGLYNSINSKVSISKNSFSIAFLMNEYGVYQDKGVSGTEKKYDTPFKYGSKMPPVKPLAEWAKKRNIRLRDAKGKFKKGNYNTIGFLIARSIQKKGIKPSLFFTKPFEQAFKNLSKDVIRAFALDVEKLMDNSINNK
tara:strand:+ start:1279 stop:1788 length:510 start_codon:yes stop_codon:yes gene_type:complete